MMLDGAPLHIEHRGLRVTVDVAPSGLLPPGQFPPSPQRLRLTCLSARALPSLVATGTAWRAEQDAGRRWVALGRPVGSLGRVYFARHLRAVLIPGLERVRPLLEALADLAPDLYQLEVAGAGLTFTAPWQPQRPELLETALARAVALARALPDAPWGTGGAPGLQRNRPGMDRDAWTARVLCARPADRGASERAVAALHAALGFAQPRVVWLGGPRALVAAVEERLQQPGAVPVLGFDGVFDRLLSAPPAGRALELVSFWHLEREVRRPGALRLAARRAPGNGAVSWEALRHGVYSYLLPEQLGLR